MIADAAFGRTRAGVVLDPVAGEDLHRSVVHLDREIDGQLALAMAQDLPHVVVEAEDVGGNVELLDGNVERGRRAAPDDPTCVAAMRVYQLTIIASTFLRPPAEPPARPFVHARALARSRIATDDR